MCGKISVLPDYPENFLITSGKKSLEKELRFLPHHCKRRKEVKNLLSFPVIKTTEQNSVVLPGNGVKIRFEDETVFCVLDGTHIIKQHALPEKTKIVLASSKLGQALLGKRVREEGKITENGKITSFTVESIIPPKKSKFVFRFLYLNVE